MIQPCMIECGHMFCHTCINEIVSSSETSICPLCREEISEDFVPKVDKDI